MSTRIGYERALSRLLYSGVHDPITGVTTSTTATEVTDVLGSLNYASGDVNAFDRKYIKLMEAADASLRGVGRVTEGGWTVTGTLTVDPAFAVTPVSGDIFIISDHPPAVLVENINLVLTSMYEETIWPLSLHIMANNANDMESSTVASADWTAENSGTLAIESTIVFNGSQSLKTTANGSGNSGATTGNINVFAGKPYYGSIMCSVQQADAAQFKAVNVQNADAQIDDDATTDEPSFTELVIPVTPPSGCEQIQFHALATASGDVAYWDDFSFWAAGVAVYPLPSWVTRPQQVVGVRAWPRGTAGPAADFDWRADEKESMALSWRFERGDRRADVPVRIVVANPGSNRPFVILRRAFDELTTDTLSSFADEDDVVFWAARLTLAESPVEKATIIKELKSNFFPKSSTTLPVRIASGSGVSHHPHRHHGHH